MEKKSEKSFFILTELSKWLFSFADKAHNLLSQFSYLIQCTEVQDKKQA